MKEWFTLAEILPFGGAALPASMSKLQEIAAEWRADQRRTRMRWGKGGGHEYHLSLLPIEVQARIAAMAQENAAVRPQDGPSEAMWAAYDRLSKGAKAKADKRMRAVRAVNAVKTGTRQAAVAIVAREFDVSPSTLWSWLKLAEEAGRTNSLAALAPRSVGRTALAPCDPRAWDHLVADYLRPEQPGFETCFYRMARAAAEHGWSPIPSSKTLKRRIEREFPRAVQALARGGRDAAQRIYPHQTRSREHFHALQAVNADGHRFDVFVRWADGTVSRPILLGFQDLYSGAILSHRIDRTENKELVRLAFADMVGKWGIPEAAWLDNGRQFASKWITGRMATRFRFKIRDEEPAGIFTQLGVTVHWTTPYHGQAKPIERAWGDFCQEISKHPAFAGAYTGRNTVEKPDNYASRAIPEDLFRFTVAREIAAHNAKPGRRTATAKGRSFLATLEESLGHSSTLVRRATAAQRRMLLMAAEGVTARAPTGEVQLEGNRYWAEELPNHIGEKLIIRFDPQDLKAAVGIYDLEGRFLCEAENLGEAGFDDVEAARRHTRARKDFLKANKHLLDAQRRLDISAVAAFAPNTEGHQPPETKIIRMVAGARGPGFGRSDWGGDDDFARGMEKLGADALGDVLPFARAPEFTPDGAA